MITIPHFQDAAAAPHYDRRFFRGVLSTIARHGVLTKLLRAFSGWASSYGVGPVVMHRALLGHHLCDGRLLPWEDTLELVVTFDELSTLAGSTAAGTASQEFLFDLNPHYMDRTTRNSHFLEVYEANRVDARFVDRTTGLYIDLTAVCRDGDFLTTKCPHRWRPEQLYPLRHTSLLGSAVSLPNDVTTILRNEYGDLDRIAAELPVIERLRTLPDMRVGLKPPMEGRGIVTTGSGKYVPFLRLLLASLRANGSRLPVEIWHRPGELSDQEADRLRDAGVEVCRFPAGHEHLEGFACKPAAILHSRFAEVLFLDADNAALADPTSLFDHPAYTGTGALLWPDHPFGIRREREFRRMLELPGRYTPVESGQMLVDRSRHWKGLNMVNELNREWEVVYRYMFGDKDTFQLGFELAGETFQILPLRPQLQANGAFRHFGPDRKPVFNHRGMGNGKFVAP